MLGPFCFCPGPGTRVGKEEERYVYVIRWLGLLIEAPMRKVEAALMAQVASSKTSISKANREIAAAEQSDWQVTMLRAELKRERKKHR